MVIISNQVGIGLFYKRIYKKKIGLIFFLYLQLEMDMENYIKYKMVGGQMKLKEGVTPHKFVCQRTEERNPVERPGYKKRQQIEYFERVLNPDICHENLIPQEEFVPCEATDLNNRTDDPLKVDMTDTLDCPKRKSVAVQVNIKTGKYRSKATNTDTDFFMVPELKTNKLKKNRLRKPLLNESINSFTSSSSACDSLDPFLTETTQSDSEVEKQNETESFKKHMQEGTLKAITREPKLFLGLPPASYACIEYLCNHIKVSLTDVLVTMKKIRWREPNSMLAIHFGVSESTVARRFRETLPKVAQCMQELVFIPSRDYIRLNLPIPFRKRYAKVVSIIDCFEVQIEKPSAAVHQALTWSQYKNANTIKYLISITPDGFINFISEGYGGRTSDALLFEDCGFLNMLSPGDVVMADRGFKNITHLLGRQGCTLLRPPSVSAGTKLNKEEVLETKRIAALRVHVERSIGRLREFEMIAPHACIDIKFVKMLDFIVLTACGVVNLQDCLFK